MKLKLSKMKNTLVNFFLIITLTCCNNGMTNKTLIKEAEVYMKDATIEADIWLTEFNKIGYAIFLDHQLPPPFDKILENSIKNNLQYPSAVDYSVIDSIKKSEIQEFINKTEQKYGAVRERKFVGIHIITKGKLLTYVPDKMKGFQEMNPKRLGVKGIKQLYMKNVEGTYAILMYESKPTKTERAEELIMLWRGDNDKWTILTYKIDDDI